MATIDVLLPVRDGFPFLEEAIESIRSQTFSDWRLLILDHGSTDNSLSVAQRYEEIDSRIKVFSIPEADGLGQLLNAGIEKCDCKFVLRLDADDIALPDRMALFADLFAYNQQHVIIGGEAVMIDEKGRKIGYLARPIGSESVTAASFFYCPVVHPAVAINLALYKKVGAAYGVDFLKALPKAESISGHGPAEDYFLFGQLALMGLCSNIGVPLIKYRVHSKSTSIARVGQQLAVAYDVSRFLSRSFSRMKNLRDFDPVPFSNHPGHRFLERTDDLSDEFRNMSEALLRGLGDTAPVRRELALRWVLAARTMPTLVTRYTAFAVTHRHNALERSIIRAWLRERLRGPATRESAAA